MTYQVTKGVVFVFGSNQAGRHGAGAAKFAVSYYGAIYYRGEGRQGRSYAIPTKSWEMEVLPLERIQIAVRDFIIHANENPGDTFLVTRIGCGLAGYLPKQIAPMFLEAPVNCRLPKGWRRLSRETSL